MCPTPGTVSPALPVRMPSGPSSTTVLPRTSRTVQPSTVAGRVSGAATTGSRVVTGEGGGLRFEGSEAVVRGPSPSDRVTKEGLGELLLPAPSVACLRVASALLEGLASARRGPGFF